MLFLSSTNNVNLPSIIGCIIILVAIIFAIWYRVRTHKGEVDAQKFLDSLADNVYKIIIEVINEIDVKKYNTLQDFEKDALSKIYDKAFNYIQEELKKASDEDVLSAIALKVLDKDTIYKFIDSIINKKDVNSTVDNVYGASKIEETSNEVKDEDKKLSEEYSDQDKYVETLDNKDLPPVESREPSKEELEKLNPQSDDEEPYNPDDISMEVIDDTYTDKNGRKRSRKTGRYV